MKKPRTLLFLVTAGLILSSSISRGQEAGKINSVDTLTNTVEFVKDDFIAASLDSLANLKFFEGFDCASASEIENIFGFSTGFVPVYADSVYFNRIKKLDAATPIDLTYNQYVKDYIELYAVKKRALTERVMGMAQIYFPLFEEHLDRYNMPLELKYLAIVESALNPIAKSPVGASGLWQFMYGTGKAYNLNVTSLVDDRRDPIKSTIAACQHMNDLYKMYHDWLLVLAAYNSGAGNVNKAIRRSGGKMNFWQIRPFLPLETRGYVPAFIAVNYVMSYAAEHNLRPVQPRFHHYEIDTVIVKDVLSFGQISKMLNLPAEEIQFLNPSFKNGIIPATKGNTYTLRLQKKNIPDFVNNEAQLYAFRTQSELEKEQVLNMMKTVTQAEYHKVKRGETLASVAKKYRCSTSEIKRWNRLKSTKLKVGQRLVVRPESSLPAQMASNESKPAESTPDNKEKNTLAAADNKEIKVANQVTPEKDTNAANTNKTKVVNKYHKVKSGESLGKIADKYNTSLANLRKWNNIKGSTIHTGDKLIVGMTETAEQIAENSTETKAKSKQNSNSLDFIYYTVRQGDTLWKIAQKHNGTVEEIKKLNNISNEKSLKPGQKIKVGVAS
ncbi:MAG: LysM peptidoglycan-binding domain-containing protein [Bacteroidales bacterium]|nr:LysM peptidoglycan-binding domain-containing protein [Bacteroidales bacterium]